jgi:hypothetical protein
MRLQKEKSALRMYEESVYLQMSRAVRGELMSDLEKRLKNLALEIQTIEVLAQHLTRDLAPQHPSAAQVNAARHLVEAIQRITETYR